MSFDEALKEAFAGIGGLNLENLNRIAKEARQVEPQLSPIYLRSLIDGRVPKPEFRRAIVIAFKSIRPRGKYGHLETDDPRIAKAKNFASEEFTTTAMVDGFIEFYCGTSFRYEEENGGDLRKVANEYRLYRQAEDEQIAFQLDDPND
ncbi:MAG: hypothetical protein IH872_12190 [Chloroflexi bacterium]|nr:hypothetical protein [Chloroflexota bacterium]